MSDRVDVILDQWRRERPDLDPSPMAVLGRLVRTARAVEARQQVTFSRHGLDGGSFDVLATLRRSGPPYELSPLELTEAAMVTSSATAQRLNKLVDRGLVSRNKDQRDGRGRRVSLTPEGMKVIEEALPEHLGTQQALLQGLDSAEQALLIGLLQRIESNAGEHPSEA
jgi:DNA-binding MarR family transcriptional regulator